MPAFYDVIHGPGLCPVPIDKQNDMTVVRHDSIGTYVYSKAFGQFKEAFFDPATTVLEGGSGKVILLFSYASRNIPSVSLWVCKIRRRTRRIRLFDIDHLKQINDSFGHLAGDEVLRHLAKLCQARLREADIICRWGGEEFIVLLKNSDLQAAHNMAEEMRLAVINNPCQHEKTPKPIACTASFGVSQYRSGEAKMDLSARADKALYQAKTNGRNTVVSL